MFLAKVAALKKEEVAARRTRLPLQELARRVRDLPPPLPFQAAVKRTNSRINLIAEVKRASPSRGTLSTREPEELARTFAAAGARAISVLTEARFFAGSPDFLGRVRQAVPGVPLLCKDFVIDEYQLWEARFLGADAILLIARLLPPDQLRSFRELAAAIGLTPLVEVHAAEELGPALASGAEVFVINNRDLATLAVDRATTPRLLPLFPPGKVVVSASGITARREVAELEELGVDAVLVGEALVTAPDPGAAVRALLGKEEPDDARQGLRD